MFRVETWHLLPAPATSPYVVSGVVLVQRFKRITSGQKSLKSLKPPLLGEEKYWYCEGSGVE